MGLGASAKAYAASPKASILPLADKVAGLSPNSCSDDYKLKNL